jgi:DNA-binding MarR family transcriptional regulator
MLTKTPSISAPTLSTEEEETVLKMLRIVEIFMPDDHRDMPIQMVRLFLIAAMNQGLGTVDLANKAGLPVSVASRYLIDLAERNRYGEDGHYLVEQRIDIQNRRQRPVRLTPKGRVTIRALCRILGGNSK